MSKFVLLAAWFPLTLILLIVNFSLLRAISSQGSEGMTAEGQELVPKQITAAAGTAQILGASVIAGDARELLISQFLKGHLSPMTPYAGHIVREADRLGIDFRLVVAIAMCESNLGKKMPKLDEFNAWGIAVYTGKNQGKAFQSWDHAISWVSSYIKTKYYDRGITDLVAIGAIWAPPSVANGNSWSNCVELYQNSIR
jgi:hypothetical protein